MANSNAAELKHGYYKLLGVSPLATVEEIQRAYKRRALELHPDKNSDPEATAQFQKLSEAYSVLSNENNRNSYDAGKWPADDYRFPTYGGDDRGAGFDMDDILFHMFFGGRGGARSFDSGFDSGFFYSFRPTRQDERKQRQADQKRRAAEQERLKRDEALREAARRVAAEQAARAAGQTAPSQQAVPSQQTSPSQQTAPFETKAETQFFDEVDKEEDDDEEEEEDEEADFYDSEEDYDTDEEYPSSPEPLSAPLVGYVNGNVKIEWAHIKEEEYFDPSEQIFVVHVRGEGATYWREIYRGGKTTFTTSVLQPGYYEICVSIWWRQANNVFRSSRFRSFLVPGKVKNPKQSHSPKSDKEKEKQEQEEMEKREREMKEKEKEQQQQGKKEKDPAEAEAPLPRSDSEFLPSMRVAQLQALLKRVNPHSVPGTFLEKADLVAAVRQALKEKEPKEAGIGSDSTRSPPPPFAIPSMRPTGKPVSPEEFARVKKAAEAELEKKKKAEAEEQEKKKKAAEEELEKKKKAAEEELEKKKKAAEEELEKKKKAQQAAGRKANEKAKKARKKAEREAAEKRRLEEEEALRRQRQEQEKVEEEKKRREEEERARAEVQAALERAREEEVRLRNEEEERQRSDQEAARRQEEDEKVTEGGTAATEAQDNAHAISRGAVVTSGLRCVTGCGFWGGLSNFCSACWNTLPSEEKAWHTQQVQSFGARGFSRQQQRWYEWKKRKAREADQLRNGLPSEKAADKAASERPADKVAAEKKLAEKKAAERAAAERAMSDAAEKAANAARAAAAEKANAERAAEMARNTKPAPAPQKQEIGRNKSIPERAQPPQLPQPPTASPLPQDFDHSFWTATPAPDPPRSSLHFNFAPATEIKTVPAKTPFSSQGPLTREAFPALDEVIPNGSTASASFVGSRPAAPPIKFLQPIQPPVLNHPSSRLQVQWEPIRRAEAPPPPPAPSPAQTYYPLFQPQNYPSQTSDPSPLRFMPDPLEEEEDDGLLHEEEIRLLNQDALKAFQERDLDGLRSLAGMIRNSGGDATTADVLVSLLKQRLQILRDLDVARLSLDPIRMQEAVAAAEQRPELGLAEHIAFTRLALEDLRSYDTAQADLKTAQQSGDQTLLRTAIQRIEDKPIAVKLLSELASARSTLSEWEAQATASRQQWANLAAAPKKAQPKAPSTPVPTPTAAPTAIPTGATHAPRKAYPAAALETKPPQPGKQGKPVKAGKQQGKKADQSWRLPCIYFPEGKCRNGDKCGYLHVKE